MTFRIHCPDCRCVPFDQEAFCWVCGAGICHSVEDCTDPTITVTSRRCVRANPHLFLAQTGADSGSDRAGGAS